MSKIKVLQLLCMGLILNNISLSQTHSITEILQKTLQQENEMRNRVYTEIDTAGNEIGLFKMDIDSLVTTEAFIIKNDTLYYTTKQHFEIEKGYYLEQQKVALKDIILITKDIGIFFETKPDKICITRYEYYDDGNSNQYTSTTDLFRTYFISLKENDYLATAIIKAFKEAGYTIKKGHWFD